MSSRILQLVFVILLFAALAPAQDPLASQAPDQDPYNPDDILALCKRYENIPIPAADLPSDDDRKQLASCSSAELYYGFEKHADPVNARKCAYMERANAKKDFWNGNFNGPGPLAMIYANGKGVARNFDLALKFDCEMNGAVAEISLRFKHLLKLKSQHWTGSDFSLCDDVTSGFLEGECAALREEGNKVQRRQRIERLTVRWNPADKQTLSELQAAAGRFFESSSNKEVDLSGTIGTSQSIDARDNLESRFTQALEQLEKGLLPQFSAADFTRADARLNTAYAKIRALPHGDTSSGMVTFIGIQETQRIWLEYREEWVKFGRQKYPGVSVESWRTWLTQERTKMLEEVYDSMK